MNKYQLFIKNASAWLIARGNKKQPVLMNRLHYSIFAKDRNPTDTL